MNKISITIAVCLLFVLVSPGQGLLTAATAMKIERLSNVSYGSTIDVSIDLVAPAPDFAIGGFDLLVTYDHVALSLQDIQMGQLLIDCEWEYFTYNPNSPAGPRIIAIAETANGPVHPSCYAEEAGELAVLTFQVTTDPNYECQYIPIRWMWEDCGDNTAATFFGDTLYLSSDVYAFDGYTETVITREAAFPSPFGAPNSCLTGGAGTIERGIDFYNGGVKVPCCCVGIRGDVNGDGNPVVGIGDLTYLVAYLFSGLAEPACMWEANINGSSDERVNVMDLTYLVAYLFSGGSPPANCP